MVTLDMIVYASNPSTWEVKAREIRVQRHSWLHEFEISLGYMIHNTYLQTTQY